MSGRRRVVYYTYPYFLEFALPFVRAMSRQIELHLILQLSPDAWDSPVFNTPPAPLPAGIRLADPALRECVPPAVRAYWQDAASFHLAVYGERRSVHPATWRTSRRVARFMRAQRPDLVHFDDLSPRAAWGLGALRRTPLLLNVHDPAQHSGERNWRIELARRLVFRRVRRFILHSQGLRAAFCTRYGIPPSRVTAIPLGASDVYRAWAPEAAPCEDGRMVLFCGRLSPYKGLDVLYAAAPRVAAQVPGVRFVVAGRPVPGYTSPTPPALPNGGRIEQIERHIRNDELARLYQEAALVVCPYIEATQSGVVLVAFGFGKPVVATCAGGLPEYVEDGRTGLLVPPGDADALAAALTRLLSDPEARQRMSAAARDPGARLAWPAIAAQTLALYGQVRQDARDA